MLLTHIDSVQKPGVHAHSAASVMSDCDPMDCSPPGSSVWDFPGKNTRVSCHFFLQGTFLTQGSNPCLLHYRWILLTAKPLGKPKNLAKIPKCSTGLLVHK